MTYPKKPHKWSSDSLSIEIEKLENLKINKELALLFGLIPLRLI